MKNLASVLTTLMFSLTMCSAYSQPMVKPVAMDNAMILQQADSLKKEFEKMGFISVKEAPLNMESETEVPIIVPLRQGTWYRIIFIGDMSTRVYEVRMFDWNERQVVYQKKMWGDVDGNIINYDFIPQFTEYHMIKPLQINKKKRYMNGYVMLFKKVTKP